MNKQDAKKITITIKVKCPECNNLLRLTATDVHHIKSIHRGHKESSTINYYTNCPHCDFHIHVPTSKIPPSFKKVGQQ